MPGYTAREALSMSLADLNFDPEPQKRRVRANRSKRDMSQSYSAFHYVLDPNERKQSGDGDGDTKSPKKGKGNATTNNKNNKPSYSDLIMDATSRTAFSQLESPTSVSEGAEETLTSEETGKIPAVESTDDSSSLEASNNNNAKPSRSMPSNADFNRPRNRSNLKSKSSHDTTSGDSVNLTPGGNRARRTRKAQQRANSGKFSRSCHMSCGDFPEPEDFTPSKKNNGNERFSKSFSDFGDWDAMATTTSTTPTRRRGKKPVRNNKAEERSQVAEEFPPDAAFDFAAPLKDEGSSGFLEGSFTELDLLNARENEITAPIKKKNSRDKRSKQMKMREKMSHSCGELDFSSQQDHSFSQLAVQPPGSRRRSSIDALALKTQVETQKVSLEEFHRGHHSEEELFPAPSSSKPATRRSRSKEEVSEQEEDLFRSPAGSKPKVQRSRNSPRNANGEQKEEEALSPTTSRPTHRRSRSKKDMAENRGGPNRQNSTGGLRLRRSHTTDGTSGPLRTMRSNHGARGKSPRRPQGEEPSTPSRTSSQGPGLRSKRRASRRSSMDAKINALASAGFEAEGNNDNSPGQSRTPRRTRSGDASAPVRAMRGDRTATGERLSGRRTGGIRRTKSSDGSTLNSFRRFARSNSMSLGSGAKEEPSAMSSRSLAGGGGGGGGVARRSSGKSLSKTLSSGRQMPPRSLSGGGDRSVVSRSTREGSGGAGKPRSPAAPRRKMPMRSKSHDGSLPVPGISRRTPRDREKSDRNLRRSDSKERERRDKELRRSDSKESEKEDKNMRRSDSKERARSGKELRRSNSKERRNQDLCRSSSKERGIGDKELRSRDRDESDKESRGSYGVNRRAMAHFILNDQ